MPSPPRVFISYSHVDEAWKDRLVGHLTVLALEDLLEVWDDRRIRAGDNWHRKIDAAMSSARVAVLLISKDFLTSEFIRGTEVPGILGRQGSGLTVVPMIVHPCAWRRVPWLAEIQARPSNGKALALLDEARVDEAMSELAVEIADLLDEGIETPHEDRAGSADLAALLYTAHRQKAELEALNKDTTFVDEEIRDLLRQQREGPSLQVGETLLNGRLELREPIGQGGFARVWKAYDTKTRSLVAVGHLFFVMEYLAGGDLRTAVLEGRLPKDRRLKVVLSVGEALASAHGHGLIHRDVKPGNVLLDAEGEARLTDFDLVRAQDPSSTSIPAFIRGSFPVDRNAVGRPRRAANAPGWRLRDQEGRPGHVPSRLSSRLPLPNRFGCRTGSENRRPTRPAGESGRENHRLTRPAGESERENHRPTRPAGESEREIAAACGRAQDLCPRGARRIDPQPASTRILASPRILGGNVATRGRSHRGRSLPIGVYGRCHYR